MTDFTLDTDRLHLRPIQQSDVAEVFQIATKNPGLTKFMTWETPEKIEETQQWFDSVQEKFPEKTIAWAILLEEKFIGIVSLEDITRKLNAVRMDVAELGYWLDPAFHGKGLMTEAAHAVMQFGFENLDLHKIIAKHFSQNTASGKVIQKLGFRHIGTSRDEAARDGVWMDGEFYELLKKDFSK